MKPLLLLLASLWLSGCASEYRKQIESGVFISRRMAQHDFLDTWGNPTRTFSTMDLPQAQVSGTNAWQGEFTLSRRHPYNVWEYDTHGVSLWFLDENLWAWKWHDGSKPKL